MTVNFFKTSKENRSEIMQVVRQIEANGVAAPVKAFGAEFKVRLFAAKKPSLNGGYTVVKAALPAVVINGMVDEGAGPVMRELAIIRANPFEHAKQTGGYFVKVSGQSIGLVKDQQFIGAETGQYADLVA